ncbi:MAG: glycosyltransferase family 4 protein [Actinomycetota bacterium]|nr:glycosyltransferase family 4 protein [Actinomycetota bacterium]
MEERLQPDNVRWAAVAWAPYSRRSEMFARELGGPLHCVHYLRFQFPLHAPIKYILQSIRTLWVLLRDRPDAVHVQNPPFICGLIVDVYCRLTGARFVTEHHSAAFGRAWAWAKPIQRYLSRRAVTNIVTSDHWAQVMSSWGAEALVMHDPFLDLPEGEAYPLKEGFNLAFIGTFASDEPIEEVLGSAALVPDVNFYITGDLRKATERLRSGAPPNVTFTGFLDLNGDYLGLLRGADAVMVLTTRDNTLQLAGCEAIAVGKPLVTSDWSYLRDLFAGGTVFVRPSAKSIAAGVEEIRVRRLELQEELDAFRAERRLEWNRRLAQLQEMVAAATARTSGAGRTRRGGQSKRHPVGTPTTERTSR